MPRLAKPRAKSLTEFVELIEGYQGKSPHTLWYRGCGRGDHDLVPSLYRHKTRNTVPDIAHLEQELMIRFQQRSIPMRPHPFNDDWDLLFFMQHYRIPTRLLDWTENPFIALYFAVTSAEFDRTNTGRLEFGAPAAVWVLNPAIWNRHALAHQSYDGGPLTTGDDELKGYQPRHTFEGMNKTPVALFGAHNSPRIVAQRGVFTITGQNVSAMEEVFRAGTFPNDCLTQIVLPRRFLPSLRKAILDHGVTESAVFPDLEGLAMEIRRTFGFED